MPRRIALAAGLALLVTGLVAGCGTSVAAPSAAAGPTAPPPTTVSARPLPPGPPTAFTPKPTPKPKPKPKPTPKPTPKPKPKPPVATGAADVVLTYFAAINAHNYALAWNLGGKNLGANYQTFVAGFAETAHDQVTILSGTANPVQVKLVATQTDGSSRTYTGAFTVTNGVITSAHLA
jgi:cell division septation protein DedD